MYLYYLSLIRTYVHMCIHTCTQYLCKYVYVSPEIHRTFSLLEKSYSTASGKALLNKVSGVRLLIKREALEK